MPISAPTRALAGLLVFEVAGAVVVPAPPVADAEALLVLAAAALLVLAGTS